MLKEKELAHRRQTRFRNGDGVDFLYIQNQLMQAAENYAIPVAFVCEKIEAGGMFDRSITDCLIMYHPDHQSEYNFFVFSISRQGKYAFVDIYTGGSSKHGAAMNAKNSILSGNFSSMNAYGKGAVIGTLIGSAVRGTLFQNNKGQFEVESNWYTMIDDILADVFGE